ncbi:hypothetical protein PENTCL1PPCAC_30406, partial [Pristionchus entomophagus]
LVDQISDHGRNLFLRVLRTDDRVSDGPRMGEYRMIIPALHRAIAEEVNCLKLLQIPQTVRLIPSLGEYIHRDLTTDGNLQIELVSDFAAQLFGEFDTAAVLLIISGELQSLLVRAAATDRAEVDHAVSKLDKVAALAGQ